MWVYTVHAHQRFDRSRKDSRYIRIMMRYLSPWEDTNVHPLGFARLQSFFFFFFLSFFYLYEINSFFLLARVFLEYAFSLDLVARGRISALKTHHSTRRGLLWNSKLSQFAPSKSRPKKNQLYIEKSIYMRAGKSYSIYENGEYEKFWRAKKCAASSN